jgi:hypothetical protein
MCAIPKQVPYGLPTTTALAEAARTTARMEARVASCILEGAEAGGCGDSGGRCSLLI